MNWYNMATVTATTDVFFFTIAWKTIIIIKNNIFQRITKYSEHEFNILFWQFIWWWWWYHHDYHLLLLFERHFFVCVCVSVCQYINDNGIKLYFLWKWSVGGWVKKNNNKTELTTTDDNRKRNWTSSSFSWEKNFFFWNSTFFTRPIIMMDGWMEQWW